jgi:hypothetical protein
MNEILRKIKKRMTSCEKIYLLQSDNPDEPSFICRGIGGAVRDVMVCTSSNAPLDGTGTLFL